MPIWTLLIGAALSFVFLLVMPEKGKFKPEELITELLYLGVCLYAFVYISKTSNLAITSGWALFCVSLMLDAADELVKFDFPAGKILEDIVSLIGIGFFTYGCKISADKLQQQLNRQQRVSEQLSEIAYVDSLTHLPNRAELRNVIDSWLAKKQPFSVLMLDLNGFKPVNDQYGHITGDALLQAVASKLNSEIRESDFVARYGGDEFIVLQANAGSDATTAPFAQKLQQSFEQPFNVNDHQFSIGVSIGFAHYPQDGVDAAELLALADGAMYRCKQQKSKPQRL